MEPIPDLLVFDWVLALGSTQAAADLLELPQSSVSRRYRALGQRFGISTRRQRGTMVVSSSGTILRLLRELCQHFRLDKQVYRWSWQPDLLHLLQQAGQIGAGSTFVKLDHGQWERRVEFLQSRILDLCFEIYSDPEVPCVGLVNLGTHLHIPDQHPLQALPESARLQKAVDYPLKYPTFSLPEKLTSHLLEDGFQLTSEPQREGDLALELRPGPPLGSHSLRLPYRLEAGWRIPPLLEEMVFSPTSLEQSVAPLHLAKPPEPLQPPGTGVSG